jgi:hypothetical protein
MVDTPARDEEALELRTRGQSFGAIATTLGYQRAHEANEAFNRALRRKPPEQRANLRREELARLDALADGVRANKQLGPDDIVRRLRAVELLRLMLLAD